MDPAEGWHSISPLQPCSSSHSQLAGSSAASSGCQLPKAEHTWLWQLLFRTEQPLQSEDSTSASRDGDAYTAQLPTPHVSDITATNISVPNNLPIPKRH